MRWKIIHIEGSGTWLVTDGKKEFFAYRASDAEWLCTVLNALS